jgi:hypothetical protein
MPVKTVASMSLSSLVYRGCIASHEPNIYNHYTRVNGFYKIT